MAGDSMYTVNAVDRRYGELATSRGSRAVGVMTSLFGYLTNAFDS